MRSNSLQDGSNGDIPRGIFFSESDLFSSWFGNGCVHCGMYDLCKDIAVFVTLNFRFYSTCLEKFHFLFHKIVSCVAKIDDLECSPQDHENGG